MALKLSGSALSAMSIGSSGRLSSRRTCSSFLGIAPGDGPAEVLMLARQVLGHQFAGETRGAVKHDLKLPICHGQSTASKNVEKSSKFGRHSGA
jgi:hypothetical protein